MTRALAHGIAEGLLIFALGSAFAAIAGVVVFCLMMGV